jgi:hypothetical protein
MEIKHVLQIVLICFVLLTAAGALEAQGFDSTGHVFIYPETKIVQLHDTFNLFLSIDTVKYLKSFLYDIEVDTMVIRLIGADRESFFNGPSGAFFFWKDTVQTYPLIGPRYVYEMLASLLGPATFVDGPGKLVRMRFVAVGQGMSPVVFRDVDMRDRYDAALTLRDSLGGLVIVCPTTYRFGDADNSGSIDISDVVYLIQYIFGGGPAPYPITITGDADCSGSIDISDAVYLIAYIFAGGPAPCNPCL